MFKVGSKQLLHPLFYKLKGSLGSLYLIIFLNPCSKSSGTSEKRYYAIGVREAKIEATVKGLQRNEKSWDCVIPFCYEVLTIAIYPFTQLLTYCFFFLSISKEFDCSKQ